MPDNLHLASLVESFLLAAKNSPILQSGKIDRSLADALAHLLEAESVRQAAAIASSDNAYLNGSASAVGSNDSTSTAGRAFDGPFLHESGIATWLLIDEEFDPRAATRIASYLAGPAIPLRHFLILDLDWDSIPGPIEIGAWTLSKPSSDELSGLTVIPEARYSASRTGWSKHATSGCFITLSALLPGVTASKTRRLLLFAPPTPVDAWQPLLLLNLWSDTPVNVLEQYLIEPGRLIERVRGSIPTTPMSEDGDWERPDLGPLVVDADSSLQFVDFLRSVANYLRIWNKTTGKSSSELKRFERLKRSALRFLESSLLVGYDADVTMPHDRASVTLIYVSALENLLTDGKEGPIDLRRRTAQRAAILIGGDDESRLQIGEMVHDAYGLRNKIAHGDEVKGALLEKSTSEMRRILRRVFVACIVVGPLEDLGTVCDQALLSRSVHEKKLLEPIRRFDTNQFDAG